MTTGVKTSEFYITLLALFIGAGLAIYGIEGGVIASVLSVAVAYIGGRSYAKKK